MENQERFIQECKYLKNLSANTLTYYKYCFKAFPSLQGANIASKDALKEDVISLVKAGYQPRTINDWIRGVNAYLNWSFREGIVKERIKLGWVKEEDKILATLSAGHTFSLINWKPRTFTDSRLHCLVCLILDCGLRISESLGLSKENIDLDNLCIRVKGKGGKYRQVPISVEMRKILFRWQLKRSAVNGNSDIAFPSKSGAKVSVRNFQRDFNKLCGKLGITGIRTSPHTLRHTFACSYLRNGGDVYFLSRILGHSSVKTTEIYLKSLGIEDLKAIHSNFSPLSQK